MIKNIIVSSPKSLLKATEGPMTVATPSIHNTKQLKIPNDEAPTNVLKPSESTTTNSTPSESSQAPITTISIANDSPSEVHKPSDTTTTTVSASSTEMVQSPATINAKALPCETMNSNEFNETMRVDTPSTESENTPKPSKIPRPKQHSKPKAQQTPSTDQDQDRDISREMEELWAENKTLKNALQTLESALKTTTDALKSVRITITTDRADFEKKLNDLELSFENKLSLYTDAENDFTMKSCKAVQKNIDKLNVELSQQISQIREKPIKQHHEENDNNNLTLQNSSTKPTQRFPPVEVEISPTEAALSPKENSEQVRHTQHDTPSVGTGTNPENEEYVTLDWYNLTSTPNQSIIHDSRDLHESPIQREGQAISSPTFTTDTSPPQARKSSKASSPRSQHPLTPKLSKENSKILFCLDSNRNILDFSKLWWTENVQYEKTGSIRSVSRVIDRTSGPLHCILISVGCNDLDSKTPEEVECAMSTLLDKINLKFPNIRIILSQITPRPSIDNDVHWANDLLANLVKDMGNVYFANQENLRDPEYRNLRDDRHLSTNVAPLFAANLKRGLRWAFDIPSKARGRPRYQDNRSSRQISSNRPNHQHRFHNKFEEDIIQSFILKVLDYRR